MDYKVYLYVISLVFSIYVLNGIHFEKIMKTNKVFEAKALLITLAMIMSYLLTGFIIDFIEVSKIV